MAEIDNKLRAVELSLEALRRRRTKVFGLPLTILVERDINPIPDVVAELVNFLRDPAAMAVSGLFASSPAIHSMTPGKARAHLSASDSAASDSDGEGKSGDGGDDAERIDDDLSELISLVDSGHDVRSLLYPTIAAGREYSPIVVGEALKHFLLSLPQSLVPQRRFVQWVSSYNPDADPVATLRPLVSALPPVNRNVLEFLCTYLHDLARHSNNDATVASLASAIGPTILQPSYKLDARELTATSPIVTAITVQLIGKPRIFALTDPVAEGRV